MPETRPGNSQACGPSAWLQQRPVQRERLQCLLRWPRRAPCQALFSSGAWPSSHRLLCEAVGRRPLLPAVFSYPSDIQLFLREEACLWQLLDLDSRKLCLTAFLFVSNQPAGQYHFLPGCVSPPAALALSCCCLRTALSSHQPGRKMQGISAGVWCCRIDPSSSLAPPSFQFPGMCLLPENKDPGVSAWK